MLGFAAPPEEAIRSLYGAGFSILSVGACTCADNRLRVWDRLVGVDGPPDREIVHSHDFNRYLTPFRAEWDPKDPNERLIIVGRCAAWCLCCECLYSATSGSRVLSSQHFLNSGALLTLARQHGVGSK